MSRSAARLLSSSLLFAACAAPAQTMPPVPRVPGVPEAAQRAAAQINPENIRADVKYLSDDRLQGRGPGTPGGRMAAAFIAQKFAQYGLKPAGDNGTSTLWSRRRRKRLT
jgi:hypothetical protein